MCRDRLNSSTSTQEQGMRSKTPKQALGSLMRLCARSERSSGDAIRLLRRWGVAEGEHQAIIDRLITERYIDDRRYAEAYAREKSQLAGWGARKIALYLRQKGIENTIIEEVTAMLDSSIQRDKLIAKLRRKASTVKADSDYELRGKLMRYVAGLGYDYAMAKEMVAAVMGEDSSEEI